MLRFEDRFKIHVGSYLENSQAREGPYLSLTYVLLPSKAPKWMFMVSENPPQEQFGEEKKRRTAR